MARNPLVFDKMVDFLTEKDLYFNRTYTTPHLWEVKVKETTRAQSRHTEKCRTLKHYCD